MCPALLPSFFTNISAYDKASDGIRSNTSTRPLKKPTRDASPPLELAFSGSVIEMFSCNSNKCLLLACNSQHFAGVVNFDFAKAAEHRLTEEERGTLVAHHRSTHVFEF